MCCEGLGGMECEYDASEAVGEVLLSLAVLEYIERTVGGDDVHMVQ